MKRALEALVVGLLAFLLLPACGGGGGGPVDTAQFTGQWLVDDSHTYSSCGSNGQSGRYHINITQNGSQISVETPNGTLTGSVNADHASWTGDYYTGTFSTTITFLDVQMDTNGFSGTYDWETWVVPRVRPCVPGRGPFQGRGLLRRSPTRLPAFRRLPFPVPRYSFHGHMIPVMRTDSGSTGSPIPCPSCSWRVPSDPGSGILRLRV